MEGQIKMGVRVMVRIGLKWLR